MTAILPIVRGRQEREVPRYAVLGDVQADGPRRVRQEVHAITHMVGNVVLAAHDPDRDVGDIVIRPAGVRPTRLVGAQCGSQTALTLRSSRWDAQIESQ